MKVIALSGSLDKESYNTKLIHEAVDCLGDGVEFEVIQPSSLACLPGFSKDWEDNPPLLVVDKLRNKIKHSDGIIIATPEYNLSIPGWLKNIVDWCSRPREGAPLRDKPVLIISASSNGSSADNARSHLRMSLTEAGAIPIDFDMGISDANKAFDINGRLAGNEAKDQLQLGVDALISQMSA